jgi:hypothetical protein
MLLKSLLILLIGILCGCSTGVYLKPTAESGVLTTINPSCPGAEEVITFSPKQTEWVEIRIYALSASRYVGMTENGTGTELHIELLLKRGLSLSLINRFGEEFERRNKATYTFRADSSQITLIESGGKTIKLPVKMFEEDHNFSPRYEQNLMLAKESIKLSDRELMRFSVDLPTIYINGEPLKISPIIFKNFEDWYFPVLNC